MRLGPDDINAARALAHWILRALAALSVAVGLLLCLSSLLQGLGAHDWYNDVTHSHPFYNGLAMILIGAALALSARHVTRWIITLPPTGCPRCGHARSPGAQDTRCPECGLEWPRT